jgi:hypothetical protein
VTTERDYTPTETEQAFLRLLDEVDPLAAFSASGLPATTPRCHEIRGLLEAWSMLPLALEGVEAPPHVRAAVLRRIEPAREGEDAVERRRRRPAWLLPLAATLVACLFGASAWLWTQVGAQRQAIARLEARIEVLSRTAMAVEPAKMRAMEQRLALVTSPGVAICPLRPMEASGPASEARGVMYVAADHQHWYLALTGLRPAPTGKAYHLWFFVDGKPVNAGAFSAQLGEDIQLGSDTMPEGTGAVGVTLEAAGDTDIGKPSGPPILFGDQMQTVT